VGESLSLYGVQAQRSDVREQVERELPGVKTFASIQQVCTDSNVDVVVVASPSDTHFAITQELLNAGKNVVVDKPMCVTVQEADTLIELAEKQRKLLTCFQNRRLDGDFLTVRKLIQDKTLGNVKWVELAYQKGAPNKAWKTVSVHQGGGRFWDLGVHMIDQMLQLFPTRTVTGVYCRMLKEFGDMREVDSHAMITIEFDDGTTGIVDTNSTTAIEKPRFFVVGDVATYEKYGVDPQEAAMLAGDIRASRKTKGIDGKMVYRDQSKPTVNVPTLFGEWTNYYANVSDALQGKANAAVSSQSVRRVIAVLQAALNSSRFSQRMTVSI